MRLYAFGDNIFEQCKPACSELCISTPRLISTDVDRILHVTQTQCIYKVDGRNVTLGLPLATPAERSGWVGKDNVVADIDHACLASLDGKELLRDVSKAAAVLHATFLAVHGELQWRQALFSAESWMITKVDDPDSTLIAGGSSNFVIWTGNKLLTIGKDDRFGQISLGTDLLEATFDTPGVRHVEFFDGMAISCVAAGDLHCLAFDAEAGALYTWGADMTGQCSGTSPGAHPTLVDVRDERDVLAAHCGAHHTVMATEDGVFGTGANKYGQLGMGDFEPKATFVRIPFFDGMGVEQIMCGRYTTYILVKDSPGGTISFAHLPAYQCLNDADIAYDVAILGAPFDSLVTYRPGARFGPRGLRVGSQRQSPGAAINLFDERNPYQSGYTVVDCGDAPLTPFEPLVAMEQLRVAYDTLLNRTTTSKHLKTPLIATLGGDHTIELPILRSLYQRYGKINVIHFDAHMDTYRLRPVLNHGNMFAYASDEGLLGPSIHLGIRARNLNMDDFTNDADAGFEHVLTDAIDEIGIPEILKKTKERVGRGPVYISLDVDVMDPAFAPATGTPESGGWTSREVKRILRGLRGLHIVGVDAYDTQAEISQIAAADIMFEMLSLLTERPSKASHAGFAKQTYDL